MILWEHRSCQPHGIDGERGGVTLLRRQGHDRPHATTATSCSTSRTRSRRAKFDDPIEIDPPTSTDFVDAARKGRRPAADIEDGHKSTLLCHLGNIALRAGRTLKIDPKTGHILDDKDAESRFWGREYRSEWEPAV